MGNLSINNHQDFMQLLASKVKNDNKLDAKEVREVSSHLGKLEDFDRNLSKLALGEYTKKFGTAEAKTMILGIDDDEIDTFKATMQQGNDLLAGKLLRNAYKNMDSPKAGEMDTYNAGTFNRMVKMADDDATRSFLKEIGFVAPGSGKADFSLHALRGAKSDAVLSLINNLNRGFVSGSEREMIHALYKAGAMLNEPQESGKFLVAAKSQLPTAEFNELLKQADANATFQYLATTGAVDNTRETPQTNASVMSQIPRETREIMINNLKQESFLIPDDARKKLTEDLYLSGMQTSFFSNADLESARLAAKVSDEMRSPETAEADKGEKKAMLDKMIKAMDDDIAMEFVQQTGFMQTDAKGAVSYHPDKLSHLSAPAIKALSDAIEKGWWDSSLEKAVIQQLQQMGK
ncbi:MAG: hypothetical protein IV090_05990 [Candidatus Sericytochromatia bacterium]|nr:hypothetical protein [Candidatus Sericytochromatia bacterium]